MTDQTILRTRIGNASSDVDIKVVEAHENGTELHGLVCVVEPLIQLQASFVQLSNPTYGTSMVQNGLFTGTPVLINDGTDTAAWTATNISGTSLTADSTTQSHGGTKSVEIDNPSNGDVWQYDKGSSQALGAYTALSLWIYVDKDWSTGDSIELYGWDGSAEVGTRVKIEDYFEELTFDVWHPLQIPLSDMSLVNETITGLRMQLVGKHGRAPLMYIDDFNIEEAGGGILFSGSAPTSKRYRVLSIIVTIVDALAGTLADASMPALSYDKLLGIASLANGIVISHVVAGTPIFQVPFSNLGDFRSLFDMQAPMSDGTNTLITLRLDFPVPLIIKGNFESNYIGFTVRDDLTGLIRFTASLRGAIEL